MDDYDKRRAELEAANIPFLRGFHQYLIDRRTGKRKACDHIDRLAFFANHFLVDCVAEPLGEAYDRIDIFLGDWFIRKASWSDEQSLEANIATFRQFYAYLRSIGHLDETRHKELVEHISTKSPTWLRHQRRYNDESIAIEDVWDFGTAEEPGSMEETATAGSDRHFVLMLSGLAAKHFKVKMPDLPKVDGFADEAHWSLCWRCDLVGSDEDSGTYYFLLTNARTLYSLVVPSTDLRIDTLVADFARILDHQLTLVGATVPSGTPTCSVVRGRPRSLIGSQNELIRFAIDLFDSPSLDILCHKLNRTPMFALDDIFPDKAFVRALQEDPPAASRDNILPFPGPSPD